MAHTHRWEQTPTSATVCVQPSGSQVRRSLRLKRGKGPRVRARVRGRAQARAPPGKRQRQDEDEGHHPEISMHPTIVVKQQEMASYFRLFEDELIQDFLRMDRCLKMTDKYLLAMTFVYFKRAHFSKAEYTRKNFFLALYLANTMVEDEEENKNEIFPWVLGKNWRKQFPRFLKQRDRLWVRLRYRAAVSRCCCEKVMAIVPSHFVWQRERSVHHSGTRRRYGDRDCARIPRGPSASPFSCALCNNSARSDQDLRSSPPYKSSSEQTPKTTYPHLFASLLNMETTLLQAAAPCGKMVGMKSHMKQSSCSHAEEVLSDESSCGSAHDASMDWINM